MPVCVQTRSRPKVTENSTAKEDAVIYSRTDSEAIDFSIPVLVVLCCLRKKITKRIASRTRLLSQRSVEGTLEGPRPGA